MKRTHLFITAFLLLATPAFAQQLTARWTEQKANAWSGQQAWLIGANFVQSNVVNELQMLQDATLNPRPDDTPYREREVDLICERRGRGTPSTTKTEGQ